MKFDEKTGFLTVTHENVELSFRVRNGMVEYADDDRHRWTPSRHATGEEEAMYEALRNMRDTGNSDVTADLSQPRQMEWTKEVFKEEGWYWWRYVVEESGKASEPAISHTSVLAKMITQWRGAKGIYIEISGPIPEPQRPEGQ